MNCICISSDLEKWALEIGGLIMLPSMTALFYITVMRVPISVKGAKPH